MATKVALIGYGHLGKWHAEKSASVFGENFKVIVENNKEKHPEIKTKYPHVLVTDSLEEALPLVTAVVIATPTSFHFELIKKVLLADKHCFCEKPMTNTFQEAVEISEILAKKPHLKFQVGHSERFHEVLGELHLPLSKKKLIRIDRLAPFKGRGDDVGIVQDLMIHDFDLISYFWGTAPQSIEAHGKKILGDHWDYVTCTITFNDGRRAVLNASRVSTEEKRSIEAVGDNGEIKIDLLNNKIFKSSPKESMEIEKSTYTKRDHLLEEQKVFFESIEHNKSPLVNINDGLITMKLIEATQISLDEGTKVYFKANLENNAEDIFVGELDH